MTPDEPQEKVEHFFRIPKVIVESGLLKIMRPSEVKVYLILGYFSNYRTGVCFPNIETILEFSGVNKNLIGKATERLVVYRLIEKKRAPRAFKFKNVYKVLRHPEIPDNILPRITEKRTLKPRQKDGRWGLFHERRNQTFVHERRIPSLVHQRWKRKRLK